jgi:hypothetical protein
VVIFLPTLHLIHQPKRHIMRVLLAVIFCANLILLSAFRPMPIFVNRAWAYQNKEAPVQSSNDSKLIQDMTLTSSRKASRAIEKSQDVRGLVRSFVTSLLANMISYTTHPSSSPFDLDMSDLPPSQQEELHDCVSSMFHLDLF